MPTAADLRARLDELSTLDRERFRRRIGGAAKVDDGRRREEILERLADEMDTASTRYRLRRASVPAAIAYPHDLPITARRRELLEAIGDHQVVIVAGETGSGKSTQLPKLCLESGRGVEGMIAHTQPRRLAARTIAARVAEELGTSVGGAVGFAVRFSDHVGDGTMVKQMTDGLLLAEIQRDRDVLRYDTVIVDEAHERSLNVDFLLGYLHRLLPRRPDLKLIITSATIDTERFARHFETVTPKVPVIEVSGRTYPVEIRYRPLDDPARPEVVDQAQGIAEAVQELFVGTEGDILVFCAGEREIRDATDAIRELELRHTEVLPLYARLAAADQQKVFQPAKGRRVVVATNVAETSLTVPGVRSVVDAGTARISRYSRRLKVQRLPIEPISRASADQRAGRCGRLGPGVCIRLYAEDDFDSRAEYTEPEIRRTSLASVILQMASIGLGDIGSFPFLDPPDLRTIRDGIAVLAELGAIDELLEGTDEWLTPVGRRLARLPVDPRFGRMILAAHENDCLREVLVVAAGLSVRDPRERPAGAEQAADTHHARFAVPGSDFLGRLALWDHIRTEQKRLSGNQFRRLCRDEFLSHLRIREWQGVHAQLRQVSDDLGLRRNREAADPESIHRSLLAGLLSHIGHKDPNSFEYLGARGARFAIQPGSTLFKGSPEWVMAAELVETSRLWGRELAALDPRWLETVGAHLVKRSHSDPWWDADRGTAVAAETVTLYGLTIAADRTVQYDRVDPAEARRIFIRHALVEGDWDADHAFLRHNRRQFAEVSDVEARGRLGDIMVGDEALERWFDERLPDDIVSVRHFDRWWRDQRLDTPNLLDLASEDLVDQGAADVDDEAFPQVWHAGDLDLPLTYVFDPTSPTDGVTVHVPVAALDRLDPAVFEWHVPGFREEMVTALLRSLPKHLRKQLVPISETVADVVPTLDPSAGPLVDVLRRALAARAGIRLLPTDFGVDGLAPHLLPHFSIHDEHGEELDHGRDLAALRRRHRTRAREAVDEVPHELERTGITSWDFGALPESVEIEGAGATLVAYPSLVDEGDSVSIRLLATPEEQASSTWDANRRLLRLALQRRHLGPAPLLTDQAALAVAAGPHESKAAWAEDCLVAGLDAVIVECGGPAWDGVAFDTLLAAARAELAERLVATRAASIEVLQARVGARRALELLDHHSDGPAVADIERQLGRLIHPGFVSGLGSGRLADLARWIRAIEHRIDRRRAQRDRDDVAMAEVVALESEHDGLVDVFGWTPQLVEIAWMLQELRVSVFAQSLGVKGTVSHKRIRNALADAAA